MIEGWEAGEGAVEIILNERIQQFKRWEAEFFRPARQGNSTGQGTGHAKIR